MSELDDPLTFALIACGFCAALTYVDFEDTIFIDASIVPLLLAAVFLSPAATCLVVIAAELGAWIRQRYRLSAALINALATGAPSIIAALVFDQLDARSGTVFYAAVAAIGGGALVLNFLLLVPLIALLDGRPLRQGLSRAPRVFPAFATNVVLVVAAANVYMNVGLGAVIFVLIVVGAFAYLIAQVFAARERAHRITQLAASRRKLVAHALNAEDRERRRLADVLHDGPIQELVTARQDLHEVGQARSTELHRTDAALGRAIDGLRSVVSELHPAVLDRRGVARALAQYAFDLADRHRVQVVLDVDPRAAKLADRLGFAIARELLLNAVRHSGGHLVRLQLHSSGGIILIEVEDNGRGLSDARRRAAALEGHVGLASIEDRVEAVEGNFVILPGVEGGARCRVELPAPGIDRVSNDEQLHRSTQAEMPYGPTNFAGNTSALTSVGED